VIETKLGAAKVAVAPVDHLPINVYSEILSAKADAV
jgi:hypothetical protein